MTLTIKQKAHALIDRLPDDAQWADLIEAFSAIADIEEGRISGQGGALACRSAIARETVDLYCRTMYGN